MNPIALYVLTGVFTPLILLVKVSATPAVSLKTWLYQNLFASRLGNMNGSLGFAVACMAFWLGIMTILYRRQIFTKI